jgi:hypothetical protein
MRGLLESDCEEMPLRERLARIGTAFLTIIINVHFAGMVWGDRALRKRFYEAGPVRTAAAVSEIISAAASSLSAIGTDQTQCRTPSSGKCLRLGGMDRTVPDAGSVTIGLWQQKSDRRG